MELVLAWILALLAFALFVGSCVRLVRAKREWHIVRRMSDLALLDSIGDRRNPDYAQKYFRHQLPTYQLTQMEKSRWLGD